MWINFFLTKILSLEITHIRLELFCNYNENFLEENLLEETFSVFQHTHTHTFSDTLHFHDNVFLKLIRPEKYKNVRKKWQKYNEVISKRNKMLHEVIHLDMFSFYYICRKFLAISLSPRRVSFSVSRCLRCSVKCFCIIAHYRNI